MSKEISFDTIEDFTNNLSKHPAYGVAANAAQTNGIFKASQSTQSKVDLDPTFSVEIDTGSVTNQRQSGRCWMFSALNTMRHSIQKEFNCHRATPSSGTSLKSQTSSLKT